MPEPNNRFWKWVSGILAVLLTASITLAFGTLKQIQTIQTIQDAMERDVAENTKWIDDWARVLRVPERDQRQDSDIVELKRRITMVEQELDKYHEMERLRNPEGE